jgi:hypothetical protein
MYRTSITIFVLSILFLAACSPAVATSDPDGSVSSDDPVQGTPVPEEWAPQSGDEDLVRGEVQVETTDVLTLESFPPQYMLHVTGWKGNPCQQLRVVVSEPDEQNQIDVEIYTVIEADAVCIQVLESLDINVPLGNLESGGEYTVRLNGTQIETVVAQ